MNRFGSILRQLQSYVGFHLAKRSPAENKFMLLVPLVGITTGVIAVAIAHLIQQLQMMFWGSGSNLLSAAEQDPWYARIAVPLLGGCVIAAVSGLLRWQTRGSGTSGTIQALALKGGYISLKNELPTVGSGIVTVASGGSLGREGPMIELAVALGSRLGRSFNLPTQKLRVIVCCAAAATIAAVYNAPIGGTIFVMEVLIGSFALEIFGPVVIAAVISTLIFRYSMSDLPRFVIPAYDLVSPWELGGYLVLGVLSGGFAVLMIRTIFATEDFFEKLAMPRWGKILIGFASVGLIGCIYPHVFGNGYESVNLALHEELPWRLMLILPFAKLLATAITRGAGGSGGLFTPTLMVGALVGGAFGYGVHHLFPQHTAEYGAYALVGMGAVLAGTTHAPIMAIMMIFEQTNSYQIILPLMFVCIISNLTARLLKSESFHLESLRRRGIKLPTGLEAGVMQSLHVSDVLHDDVEHVRASAPFAEVVERFLKSTANNLYVTDLNDRFLGAIPMHALKEMLHQGENLGMIVAQDLVDDTFLFVTPEMRLADTMEGFWTWRCERLPVVDNPERRRLIGWISKRDLIGVYNQEILHKRQLLSRFTVEDGDARKDVFVELPEGFRMQSLIVPDRFTGRTLRELALRSNYNVQVLQISHRDPQSGRQTVEMPGPESRLVSEDRIIVIGTIVDIARLMSDVGAGLENANG